VCGAADRPLSAKTLAEEENLCLPLFSCMHVLRSQNGLCPALVHGACIAFPSPLGIQWEMLTTTKSEAWPVHFGNVPTGASWHETLHLLDLCSDVT
jgi:hypothetical protein